MRAFRRVVFVATFVVLLLGPVLSGAEYTPRPPADALRRDLASDDPAVRRSAVEIIQHQRRRDFIDDLIPALKDPKSEVRWAALQALADFGEPRTLDVYIALAKSGEKRTRGWAIDVLARSGDARTVAPLISLLSDPDAGIRSAAVRALGGCRTPESSAALVKALSDPDAGVSNTAKEILGRRAGPPAVPHPAPPAHIDVPGDIDALLAAYEQNEKNARDSGMEIGRASCRERV